MIIEGATPIRPFKFSSYRAIYSMDTLIISIMAIIMILKAHFFRPIGRVGTKKDIKITRNTSFTEIRGKIKIHKLDKQH